jgi:hypothetical protein
MERKYHMEIKEELQERLKDAVPVF